jgi:hypothetical protein
MKNGELFSLGGVSSMIQAVFYAVAVAALAFIPREQITGDMGRFTPSFAERPEPLVLLCVSFIALSVLGIISVVPATAQLLSERSDAWMVAGRNVAYLSLSVTAIYFVWFLWGVPARVAAFQSGDAAVRSVLDLYNPHAPMDWVVWFTFGGMGLWVAIVGVLGRRTGVLPRKFAWVCALKAGGFWIVVAGTLLGSFEIGAAGAVIGGLFGGVSYHVWLGKVLLNSGGAHASRTVPHPSCA